MDLFLAWCHIVLVDFGQLGLCAVGFALVLRVTGIFNIGHALPIGIGAYVAVLAIPRWGLGAALVLATVAGACLGVLLDLGFFRAFRSRGTSPEALVVGAFALLVISVQVNAHMFDSDRLVASVDASERELATVIAVSAVVLVTLALRSTTVATVFSAMSSSTLLYQSLGADTRLPRFTAFVLGSGAAGVGGALVGLEAGARPDIGEFLLLPSVVATMLGLSWSFGFWPAVLAIAALRQAADWLVGQMWRDVLSMIVLIGILLTIRGRSLLVARGAGAASREGMSAERRA